MDKIRKYNYPVTQVFYKDKFIGTIENESEFIMFRIDMIDNPEHMDYHLITPSGERVVMDEYGIFNYCPELEEQNKLLAEIIEKQMAYRLRKSGYGN